MKKIIMLLLCATVFFGCENSNEMPLIGGDVMVEMSNDVVTRSYILGYFEPVALDLSVQYVDYYSDAKGRKRSPMIGLHIGRGDFVGTYKDEGEKKAAYDALSEKYGDMTFNDVVTHICFLHDAERPWLTVASGLDIVSIDVVSDRDLTNYGDPNDSEIYHAGTSLNRFFNLTAITLKPFIDAGYAGYADDNGLYGVSKNVLIDDRDLTRVTTEDLKLLGAGFTFLDTSSVNIGRLVCLERPKEKIHNITITIEFEDGRKLSDTIEITCA